VTESPSSDSFFDKPEAELEQFLLRVARADAAPKLARERALHSVTSAALGLGVLSGAAALGSRSTLLKGTSWLVAKWLAAGMSTGLLGIAVAQGVQQLVEPAPQPAPRALSAPTKAALRPNLSAALVASESATSVAEAEPAPAVPAPVPASAAAPGLPPVLPVLATAAPAPVAREPKSPSASASAGTEAALANSRSSLTRELTILEQVHSALAQHSAGRALQALDEYRAEFPRGSLQIEAAALRVEAVAQSGDHAQAQRLAQAFLTSFPTSPLCARVRAFSEVFVGDAQKP
jgi:hypothetical protein